MSVQTEGEAFMAIDEAILNQQVIQIRVNKQWRTFEPYMTGFHKRIKKPVVYGLCRDIIPSLIHPSRWQTFSLEDIDAIEMTYYFFEPHVDYWGEDDCMLTLYRKLQPRWVNEKYVLLEKAE